MDKTCTDRMYESASVCVCVRVCTHFRFCPRFIYVRRWSIAVDSIRKTENRTICYTTFGKSKSCPFPPAPAPCPVPYQQSHSYSLHSLAYMRLYCMNDCTDGVRLCTHWIVVYVCMASCDKWKILHYLWISLFACLAIVRIPFCALSPPLFHISPFAPHALRASSVCASCVQSCDRFRSITSHQPPARERRKHTRTRITH